MPQMFPTPVTLVMVFTLTVFLLGMTRVYWHSEATADLESKPAIKRSSSLTYW